MLQITVVDSADPTRLQLIDAKLTELGEGING